MFLILTMIFALMVVFVSGCVTAKTYYMDKEREDQEMYGNAGYVGGTPPAQDRSNVRKTKRTYVLEVTTKGPKEEDLEAVESESKVSPQEEMPRPEPRSSQVRQAPSAREVVTIETEDIEYKVQKNDTLQKISKQFYGGYSKWPRIYEANKSIIKDPNRIKPGIVIVIPGVEKK